MKAIETHNLTKYYGKIRGIQNLNLEVNEGEIFGFIGPNGAGKSTTIRTLLNLIFPTSGSASILGLDMVRDSKEIRKQIGYIPSELNYYGDLSVKEMLGYSASFYTLHDNQRIGELMERFELNPLRKVEELSLGNKRKLAIVQALIHSPRLLILDEPTSGLDPLMQNVFFEVLREENQRATIFFSSHILGEVQRMCDRIAIIKQGEIIKVERMDELRNTRFKNLTVELESSSEPMLQIEGMVQVQRQGHQYKALFNGDIGQLLQELSKMHIHNLLIEEPSLEEIFLHYYEKGVEDL